MKSRLLLVLTALGLAILACTGEQKLGSLVAGATPVPVVLRGEVNHVWNANVEPGNPYELRVVSYNLKHPLEMVDIVVLDEDRVNLVGTVAGDGTVLTAVFTAPESGLVRIEIYSLVGERNEELGTLTVQLHRIDP